MVKSLHRSLEAKLASIKGKLLLVVTILLIFHSLLTHYLQLHFHDNLISLFATQN